MRLAALFARAKAFFQESDRDTNPDSSRRNQGFAFTTGCFGALHAILGIFSTLGSGRMTHVLWRGIVGLLVVVFAIEISTGLWFARHPNAETESSLSGAKPIGRMIRQTLRPDDGDNGTERLRLAANLRAGPNIAASALRDWEASR